MLGFARRFATYKRATLIFSERERLARLLNDPDRPVVLIMAGKAHPHDEPGKRLIEQVYELSMKPEFIGKVHCSSKTTILRSPANWSPASMCGSTIPSIRSKQAARPA